MQHLRAPRAAPDRRRSSCGTGCPGTSGVPRWSRSDTARGSRRDRRGRRSRCGRTRPRAGRPQCRRRRRRCRRPWSWTSRRPCVDGAAEGPSSSPMPSTRRLIPSASTVTIANPMRVRRRRWSSGTGDDRTGGHRRSRVKEVAGQRPSLSQMTSLRPISAAVAGLALLAAACATEADDPVASDPTTAPVDEATSTTAGDGFTPEPIEWDDCGGVECATLEVPLDYSDPDGELIELYVVRTPATGERKGALFTNPGGPGASGRRVRGGPAPSSSRRRSPSTSTSSAWTRVGSAGAPPSTAVSTPPSSTASTPTIETPEDEEALLDVSERYVDDCADEVPRPPPSPRHARRRPGHGHRARRHGRRAAELPRASATAPPSGRCTPTSSPSACARWCSTGCSSSVRPDSSWPTSRPPASRRRSHASSSTATPPRAAQIAGEALEAVEEVLAMAEEPGGIPAPDADRPAGPGEANLGHQLRALLAEPLGPARRRRSPTARGGDASELVDLADGYIGIGDFEIYFAVNCMDFAWPTGDPDAFLAAAKASAERSPHFGEALVNDYIRCVDWPVPPTPARRPPPPPGTPPILVISTTGDPATPYEGGRGGGRDARERHPHHQRGRRPHASSPTARPASTTS